MYTRIPLCSPNQYNQALWKLYTRRCLVYIGIRIQSHILQQRFGSAICLSSLQHRLYPDMPCFGGVRYRAISTYITVDCDKRRISAARHSIKRHGLVEVSEHPVQSVVNPGNPPLSSHFLHVFQFYGYDPSSSACDFRYGLRTPHTPCASSDVRRSCYSNVR